MARVIKDGDNYNIPIKEYCCDTKDEFESEIEPDNSIQCGSKVYILHNEEDKLEIKIKCLQGWATYYVGSGDGSLYEWAHLEEGF